MSLNTNTRLALQQNLGPIPRADADAIFDTLNQQTVSSNKVVFGNGITVTTGGATITAGGLTVTAGGITVAAGISDFSAAGLKTIQSVANVHDTAPTDASLDSAFGAPATVGRGFIGTIDDNDGSTISYLVWATDAAWFYVAGTLAT